MLRPFPGKYLEECKQIFNYRLSRARRIIEITFGILAAKFRIFKRPIIAKPEKVTKITKAACCLHNYLKMSEAANQGSRYCAPGLIDQEDRFGNHIPGDWRLCGENWEIILDCRVYLVQAATPFLIQLQNYVKLSKIISPLQKEK